VPSRARWFGRGVLTAPFSSAFGCFDSFLQLGKELGARWKRLSEEEKERYKTLAKEQNERKAAERKESPGGEAEDGQGKGGVQAKPPGLPTAVVKRLVLSDPELKRISAPALNLVINSAERFIGLMTQRSREVAITSGKRTIRMQDILAVAREGGWRMAAILDHLKEVSPLIEAQDAKQQANR